MLFRSAGMGVSLVPRLSVPGLVGWEHHGAPAKIPGLEVVAEGVSWKSGTTPAHWTATIFPGPKNNFVFNAATIWWPQAMAWTVHAAPQPPFKTPWGQNFAQCQNNLRGVP